MYIQNIDKTKMEIILNENEIIVCGLENKTVIPLHMKIIKNEPKPGERITINVVENGFLINSTLRTRVQSFSKFEYDFNPIIYDFLNHNVESKRELTENELFNEDMDAALAEIQEYYNHKED